MAISQSQKDDLVTSAVVEMHRVFFALINRRTAEEIAYLNEIQTAMKAAALTFGNLPSILDEED